MSDLTVRRGRVLGLVTAAALALAVSACANTRADTALAAQTQLVGLTRNDLLGCAGVPHRTFVDGATEFLTYVSQSIERQPQASLGLGFGSRGVGYGLGFGVPFYYATDSRYCEATFRLDGGAVTGLNYIGNAASSGARLSECYAIIESCMALAGARSPGGV